MPLEERIAYAKSLKERLDNMIRQNSSRTNNNEMKSLISSITMFININNTLPEANQIEVPEKYVRLVLSNK